MGNLVGVFGKNIVKKARRFNVESRTEKFLSKNEKNPPPKHVATLREIEKLNREVPDLMEKINRPNAMLVDRLKDVYVSSSDPPPDKMQINTNPNRPYPTQRRTVAEKFGYVEPESVTPGHLTLQQALKLLSKYQRDKTNNTIKSLALEYNLSEKDLGDIVEHFKIYTLVQSESKTNVFDTNPLAMIADATAVDEINVITAPEQMKALNKAVQDRSEKINKTSDKLVKEKSEKINKTTEK